MRRFGRIWNNKRLKILRNQRKKIEFIAVSWLRSSCVVGWLQYVVQGIEGFRRLCMPPWNRLSKSCLSNSQTFYARLRHLILACRVLRPSRLCRQYARYSTFIGPCIVIFSYDTTNKMHLFLKLFILVKRSTCFRRSFRPSSGAQNFTCGNRYMSNSCC